MLSLNQAINAVCRLPVDYHQGGHSPAQIVADADYFHWRGAITIQAIYQHLQESPELLGEWVIYSENKRCDGWHIDLAARRLFLRERAFTQQEQVFEDPVEACAHYIRYELESICHTVA